MTNAGENEGALLYRELALEPASFRATIRGQPLRLTKREFEILACLLAQPGRVYSRRELSECSWGSGSGGTQDSVYVHISHIRRKIWELCGDDYIATVRGRGFRMA